MTVTDLFSYAETFENIVQYLLINVDGFNIRDGLICAAKEHRDNIVIAGF